MNFVTKFSQKGYFRSKKEINENHHRILNIRIKLGSKFQLEQKILIFWNNFLKKEYFQSKTEKLNISIGLFIFELVKVPDFSLNRQIWIFGPNLPKKGFSSLKQIKCCMSFTNNGTDIIFLPKIYNSVIQNSKLFSESEKCEWRKKAIPRRFTKANVINVFVYIWTSIMDLVFDCFWLSNFLVLG